MTPSSNSIWRFWTVELEKDGYASNANRVIARWHGEAVSEDEAIGKALRHHGLHDGWTINGWWPSGTVSAGVDSVGTKSAPASRQRPGAGHGGKDPQ